MSFIVTHFISYIFDTKHSAMQFFKTPKTAKGWFYRGMVIGAAAGTLGAVAALWF
jgi:hypothetical protein